MLRRIAADLKSMALNVTTDSEHKFELAIALDELEMALALAEATPAPENEVKWKLVGDTALSRWKFGLARECYRYRLVFPIFWSVPQN